MKISKPIQAPCKVSVGSYFHGAHGLMCRSGITHEEMVQESKRHWQRLEQNAQKHQKVSKDKHTHTHARLRSQVSGIC